MPTWKAKASRLAPRAAALLWATYDASRSLAYLDTSPPQLSSVGEWMPLWIPWAATTALLVLGALVPTNAGEKSKHLARLMRQWGMTLTLSLLLVWGVAFIISDFTRGWVTGGSYIMLAAFAGWSGWVASRDLANVQAVKQEELESQGEADAGMAR